MTASALRIARSLRLGALACVLGALLGCATVGLTPVATNQPVARQALLPEYRVFYDALVDYGDWVLIEPYGFVFRPRVAFNQWQPFEDGFWAPTDAYGWVWISAEPFGWATYHYGQWFYDNFQGWVWLPGVEWMPGSVSWLLAGDYVGWGPLTPPGSAGGALPAGSVHYAPIGQLGATDLRQHLVARDQLGAAASESHAIHNVARVGGVTIDRGPALELVEQKRGPLTRAHVEDLVPVDLGRRISGSPTRASFPGRAAAAPDSTTAASRDAIDRMRRAGEQAASEARRLVDGRASAPVSLPVVRPMFGPRGTAPGAPRRDRAPADSTR